MSGQPLEERLSAKYVVICVVVDGSGVFVVDGGGGHDDNLAGCRCQANPWRNASQTSMLVCVLFLLMVYLCICC